LFKAHKNFHVIKVRKNYHVIVQFDYTRDYTYNTVYLIYTALTELKLLAIS